MNQFIENRREFLKRASLAAAAMPFLLNCRSNTLAQKMDENILSLIRKNAITDADCNWCGAKDVPDNVSWKTVLAGESDKGEPIIISGRVFRTDGVTPAPNALIYFYHTDTEGFYGRKGEVRHGRYRGWLLTDAQGRYEFRTIKAAPYPGRTFAAHIHMTLTTKSLKENSVDSILFEGDRFITPEERNMAGKKGGFNPILKLEKGADGIQRGVRDIQLWEV
jgi:protocatechuate 3,4-dioxygenase beta subunit